MTRRLMPAVRCNFNAEPFVDAYWCVSRTPEHRMTTAGRDTAKSRGRGVRRQNGFIALASR
jgi:hypothetical protein